MRGCRIPWGVLYIVALYALYHLTIIEDSNRILDHNQEQT
jgi:hypothetical protein